MNGRRILDFATKTTLALAILALAASAAIANPLYKGSFTLTQETRWGNVDLSPGHYTFTVSGSKESLPLIVTIYRANERSSVLMAVGQSIKKVRGQSALILTGMSTGSAVRELRLAELDLTLSFSVRRAAAEAKKQTSGGEVAVKAEK